MNEADNKVKLQIVEKIKSSTNILVTVSKDPSVDELSAALGLTALLNKLDKHATAIFSGAIPPAITFLDPDKVFENTADSLRDFIIALDKEKADHLRYKVEGDVVKIFITPYRTVITDEDLEFSQGNYNIELVLALGVENQEHLDAALAANGQILHDVTIATFSAGEQASQLGGMDWRDAGASSQSEMVAGIADALKIDKTLLDKQIATALLTGIVSATDRFSNPLTSSRVMALAAQLMAAGADQQLIAAKLQESHAINSLPSVSVEKIATSKSGVEAPIEPIVEQATLSPDLLTIPHELPAVTEKIESISTESAALPKPDPVGLPKPTAPSISNTNKLMPDDVVGSKPEAAKEPLLGGILNATSDQAAEDARRELDDQQNKTILTHSYLDGSESDRVAPINSIGQTEVDKSVDIFAEAPTSTIPPQADTLSSPTPPVVDLPPPLPPALPVVTDSTLPLPPSLPDFSTLPNVTSASTPALSDMGAAPVLEPVTSGSSTLPPTTANANDPSQFQIPV